MGEVGEQIDKLVEEINSDISKAEENKNENLKLISGLEGCVNQCGQLKATLDEVAGEHAAIKGEIEKVNGWISEREEGNFDQTFDILWDNIEIKIRIKELVARLTAI